MQFSNSALWDFSINFYGDATVEEICLEFQNQYQLDVNLILLAVWSVIEQQQSLTKADWQNLIAVALPWQEVIKSLRTSRQLIKESTIAWPSNFQNETHKTVGQLELNTEHMQQLALERAYQNLSLAPLDASEPLNDIIKQQLKSYLDALTTETTLSAIDANIDKLCLAIDHYQANKKTIAQ